VSVLWKVDFDSIYTVR